MKYIKAIAFIMFVISAAGCTLAEINESYEGDDNGTEGQIQVACRITQFTDCDVMTRSKKDGDEGKVTSMGLALFPFKDDGTLDVCIDYYYQEGGNIIFVVDRNKDIYAQYFDKKFAMYVFANMQDSDIPATAEDGIGKSLDKFMSLAHEASAGIETVPENGFPMIGMLGDAEEFILKPTASDSNENALPTVGGTPTDNLEIPMEAMYAKFSFEISVESDQEIVGNKAPRFDLNSYTVKNIAKKVCFDKEANSEDKTAPKTEVIGTSDIYTYSGYAQGATTATFDFYLPERYLTPAESASEYGYPFKTDDDEIRKEDEKYRQRFKSKLLTEDQLATYLTIQGTYHDHQGHDYVVTYDIYLGGDNYENFDIVRNTHYNNSIVIRGLSCSNDQALDEEAISIDHRVDVVRTSPLLINLRRETLLDAHFEVRPLRLRILGDVPAGASATVEVLNADGTEADRPAWVRLEKSYGGSSTPDANTYITTGVSAGKRLYFTTDLVTNTLKDNTSITVSNLSNENSVVWIYVDENTNVGAKTTRSAMLRITYADESGANDITKDYIISQYDLHEITYGGYTYLIECHEEYLHNYDAEDEYGQTEYEGMAWGLDGVQLSYQHRAMYVEEKSFKILEIDFGKEFTGIVNNLLAKSSPYYDFYLENETDMVNVTTHSHAGFDFNSEIISAVDIIADLTLEDKPQSAVEYCYNKNRRDSNGNVVDVQWYLPAIDEMEDIMMGGYSEFDVFQNQYYWSCQPAFYNVFVYYDNVIERIGKYSRDNVNYARATKANYLGNYQYEPTYSVMYDYFYYTYIQFSGNKYSLIDLLDSDKYSAPEIEVPNDGMELGSNKIVKATVADGYQARTEKNRVRCVYRSETAAN